MGALRIIKRLKKKSQNSSFTRVERMINRQPGPMSQINFIKVKKAKITLANRRIYETFKTFFYCFNLFAKKDNYIKKF